MPVRYVAYERVSTDRQDLRAQQTALTKFADAKGIEITEFFGDVAGYPYKNRPGFDAMMGRLRRPRPGVDGVLVFRIDRLPSSILQASRDEAVEAAGNLADIGKAAGVIGVTRYSTGQWQRLEGSTGQ